MCGWESLAAVWASRVNRSRMSFWKDLDGHPALEPLVASSVDHAHAAAADLALDGIGVAQGLTEPSRQRLIGGVGHE
jgi:hypothetical protein